MTAPWSDEDLAPGADIPYRERRAAAAADRDVDHVFASMIEAARAESDLMAAVQAVAERHGYRMRRIRNVEPPENWNGADPYVYLVLIAPEKRSGPGDASTPGRPV